MGFLFEKEKSLTLDEVQQQYDRPSSFVDQLPFANYDADKECVVFSDNISTGAVLEITPLDGDARPNEILEDLLDRVETAFDVIDLYDENPWVVQLFTSKESIQPFYDEIEAYYNARPTENNPARDNFLKSIKEHFSILDQKKGIFMEDATGIPWGGSIKKLRLCIYRQSKKADWPNTHDEMPGDELNQLISSLEAGFKEAGIYTKRYSSLDIYQWLYCWLNPKPYGFENPFEAFNAQKLTCEDIDWNFDIPMGCLNEMPKNKDGEWYFNGMPHRYVPVIQFKRQPRPGQLTLEKNNSGNSSAAVIDRLPEGSIHVITIVFEPQDVIEGKISFIQNRSGGKAPASKRAYKDCEDCLDALEDHKMFSTSMGVYVRADNKNQLKTKVKDLIALLNAEQLQAINTDVDLMANNSYLNYLPFAYRPQYDQYLKRSRLQFLRNVLAASSLFGQSRGTGNPGYIFYNRGGEPVTIDLLNKEDRTRAAHMLVLGPTGAGKSVLANGLIEQDVALYKPHIYIIDVGDSFRLSGDYFKSLGYKVVYKRLDDGNEPVSPFAFSEKMLLEQEFYGLEGEELDTAKAESDREKNKRDYLSEMVTAAKLMITGGEEKEIEEFRRFDIAPISAAIKRAAIRAYEAGHPHATVSDFIDAMDAFIGGEIPPGYSTAISQDGIKRIEEMRDSVRLYTEGLRGRIFNRYEKDHQEADITIIDLGKTAMDDDKVDIMNLAVIGVVNSIQSEAERRRGSGRQTMLYIDEAHVTTVNPLTSDYLAKGSKMWRKWGLWLRMLTQNLKDFPDNAKKILNMAEFWFCLCMPKEEVEQIARFRTLTVEQKALLENARKEDKKYTEGVLLSDSHAPLMFRNVPIATSIALSMTDEDEVTDRHEMQQELGLETELEACFAISKNIVKNRREFAG